MKPLYKSPFSGPKQPLPVARHLLEPGLRQQQGAVAVAEYSQEEVGTVEQKAIFIITFAIVTRESYNIIGAVYVNVSAMCQYIGYWSGQAPGAHRLQRRGGRGGAQVALQALLPGPQGQGQH